MGRDCDQQELRESIQNKNYTRLLRVRILHLYAIGSSVSQFDRRRTLMDSNIAAMAVTVH